MIDLSDVGRMNAAYVEYVNSLPLSELRARVDALTFKEIHQPQTQERGREVLRREGIVIIPEAIQARLCDTALSALDALLEHYVLQGNEVVEDEMVLYQTRSQRLKGFGQLAGYGKTVINVRSGADMGMCDIFNCDLALHVAMRPFRSFFESESVGRLLQNCRARSKNLNAYLNRGVVATRGFHVDAYHSQLKAFLYLTDVNSLEDGPYTFVRGSHVDTTHQRLNQLLCEGLRPSTETPVVSPKDIVPALAPRGTLIISDQAGSHRGWPQSAGRNRVALVMKYA